METTKKINPNDEEELRTAEQLVGSDATLLEHQADGTDPEEQADGIYTHTFSKPILYDGKTYEKLTFDFDSLTGADSLDVESELMAKGRAVLVRTIDSEYLIRMAARACTESIGADIFRLMPVKDYGRITNIAKRFF